MKNFIAQGMPDCSDCTCMLVCVFLCAICTRDRGCSVHPVFPAPSLFRRDNDAKLGRKMSRERETISTSLRAQRSNPCLNAGKDGLLPPSLSELRRTSRCARNDVEGPQRTGCAPSARVTAASGAAHCLHNTIFSCNAFIEQRGGQSGITMCSFGTQIAALDSTNYFCWSTGDCNGDDLFSTQEEPTDIVWIRGVEQKIKSVMGKR